MGWNSTAVVPGVRVGRARVPEGSRLLPLHCPQTASGTALSISLGLSLLLLQKLEEMLVKTKKEKPTFIPYFISACKDLPGKFLLGYQPRGKPRCVVQACPLGAASAWLWGLKPDVSPQWAGFWP